MAKDKSQTTLFGEGEIPEDWQEHWKGMPEFIQGDLTPYRTIYIHFEGPEDVKKFAKLMDRKIGPETKYLWFPKQSSEPRQSIFKEYVDES